MCYCIGHTVVGRLLHSRRGDISEHDALFRLEFRALFVKSEGLGIVSVVPRPDESSPE